MSAATAQSTDAFASPPSRQLALSWELSTCSPCPRPASPPSAAPVPPPPPPISWNSTMTTRPTSPTPPPPTASPRPPPRRPPPPRMSRTLDVSTLAFSRYLMLGCPPGRLRTSAPEPDGAAPGDPPAETVPSPPPRSRLGDDLHALWNRRAHPRPDVLGSE